MMYPLAFVLSVFGSLVFMFTFYILRVEYKWATAFSFIGRSLAGTFNLAAFLFDPTLFRASKAICSDLHKLLNDKQPSEPNDGQSIEMTQDTEEIPIQATKTQSTNGRVSVDKYRVIKIDMEALLMRYL